MNPPIVAFMISCMGMVHMTHVYNTLDQWKTAERLLALIKEKEYIKNKLNLKLIGWVSDASGESRATCIWLQEQFPHLIVADCYAHQVQLVLGDYIKKNEHMSLRLAEANGIINWFNNHSIVLLQSNAALQTKQGLLLDLASLSGHHT
ncbi:uncharacterized protein EI90DRAFT_3017326 [Cantharellus anzutake]|uniref:uncharacterized protein n=1 Tax=Cantharellus anzutake TaxID=1750568 RepID=UPI0019069506|nr:uncharacterized protein EI90DRAFT_3017326 [Cantharellus anzutake]KAF8329076.1 hypothetical protein EI90DRAFT_3017326 [Cantharellus anzutake]